MIPPPLAVNSPNPAESHATVETSSRPSRASCGKAGYSACDAPTWGRGPDPSQSSVDKPGVEELARRLKKEGIEPFLDKWNLIPGQPWQEALEEALGQSASCAVIIGSGPFGPWHHGVSNPRAIIGVAARSDTDRVSPSRPPASGRCPGRNSSGALWSATACRFFLSSRFRGQPPFRPRARAACGLNQGATDGIVIGPADHVQDDRDEFLVWPWDDWKSGVSSTRLFGTRSGRFVPSIRDDRATSAVRARLLRQRGHTALTAGSLAAALKAAGAEDLDRLISDLGRPDGSGLELMRRRCAWRAVTGIAPSGFGRDEDIRRSRGAGFAGHLTKPIDLRRREAMSRQVAS